MAYIGNQAKILPSVYSDILLFKISEVAYGNY